MKKSPTTPPDMNRPFSHLLLLPVSHVVDVLVDGVSRYHCAPVQVAFILLNKASKHKSKDADNLDMPKTSAFFS